jgi:hypothetical protein
MQEGPRGPCGNAAVKGCSLADTRPFTTPAVIEGVIDPANAAYPAIVPVVLATARTSVGGG